MKLSIQAGSTSQTINVWIQDSSSTIGAGLTGLVFNSSGLTAYYALPLAASVAITLATLSAVTSAYSSGGFKEIDATNMPGWYRLDLPNAAIASGRFVSIHLRGATNMAPCPVEIELTGWNNQDAVHGGLSALPNVAAGATNGLPLAVDSSGRVDVLKVNGTSQTARDIGASVLLSAGTGTGQLDFTSGVVKANAVQLLGTAWLAPGTAGTPDVNAKLVGGTAQTGRDIGASVLVAGDFSATMKTSLNAATPASVQNIAAQTGDSYARLGAPAGASVSADVAAVKTDTAGVKAQTDKLVFTVPNQVDVNVVDWKGSAAPAMTGDAFARIGAAGAGLTALGDTRIANLDAAVSSRSTYAGADTAGTTTLLTRIPGTVQPQTGDSFARLGAPAGASIAADLAEIEAETDAAASAGDPWSTALPGAYGTGTAGYIVGHFVSVPNSYTGQGSGDSPYLGR